MRLPIVALTMLSLTLPAFAESGDAAAIVQYCGKPISEHQGVSQVTNQMQRDLTYGDLILHFQPSANGWSFLSGWDHLPMTRSMVESRMPCVHEALAASASQQAPDPSVNVDPSIRAQVAEQEANHSTFGVPHLGLILVLILLLVASYFFLPGTRRESSRLGGVESIRRRRKPELERFLHRDPHTSGDL